MLKSSDLNERWAEKIGEINFVLDWEVAIKYETKNCYNLMVRSPRLMPQSRSDNSTKFVLLSSRGRKRVQLTLFWQQNEQNCHCGR